MNIESPMDFNRYTPDELSELYEKNPEYFNELAAAAIYQACTGKTHEQTIRLRQIQWSIEGQLRKAKTPLGRMQIMENIFYSRVFGDNGELANLIYNFNELLNTVCGIGRIPTGKPALHLLKNCGDADEIGGHS